MTGHEKYTELDVWKQARELAIHVYELTASYPKSEQFGIVSQIRMCVISVPSNIAEGFERQHTKEMMSFLSIARGSFFELETQLYILKDLSFITNDELIICLTKIEGVGKLINGFMRYFKTKT